MRATSNPTLRELSHGIVPAQPAPKAKDYRWIDDDPELSAKKPRAEIPLSAWL